MAMSNPYTVHCDGEEIGVPCHGWVTAPPLVGDELERCLREHGWIINDRPKGHRIDLCPEHVEDMLGDV